jgi:signal peptidase
MKIISHIFYGLFITLLLLVALLFLVPLLPIENNISMKIVESGSMEPAITTGSLVVVIPTTSYSVGEIITFESTSSDVPTTHRIVNISEENGERVFTTKGDANEEADTNVVTENNVIGKVQVAVPYVGFVLDFARQPLGFGFLIVLPALMIIFGEIEKIWREIRRNRKDKGGGTATVVDEIAAVPDVEVREIVRMIEIGRPISTYEKITNVRHLKVLSLSGTTRRPSPFGEVVLPLFAVVTSVCFASMGFIGSTVSYLNDTESSLQNLLRATALDFNVLADGDVYNFLGTDLVDDDGALITIVAPEDGSVDAKYTITTEKIEGSELFCGAILASTGAPMSYDGPLLGLSAEGISFSDPWEMSLSLSPDMVGLTPYEECVIDIVYTAWNSESETGVGYSDVERVQLEFYAPVPEPEAFSAFSLPEETSSPDTGTTTSSTTEPITPPIPNTVESTEGNQEDVPPTEGTEEVEDTTTEEPEEPEPEETPIV